MHVLAVIIFTLTYCTYMYTQHSHCNYILYILYMYMYIHVHDTVIMWYWRGCNCRQYCFSLVRSHQCSVLVMGLSCDVREGATADSTVSAWLGLISAVCWSCDCHVTSERVQLQTVLFQPG